jgi:hypothetical protein
VKTVAIVGTEAKTRDLTPWDDLNVDIWVLNESAGNPNGWVKRCNGTFQLHDPKVYKSPHNRSDPYHWEWLQKPRDYPIWMQDIDPFVPGSQKYPLDEINQMFSSGFQWPDEEVIQFYTSTVPYMIALAVYLGYKKIKLYGVEMSSNTEYYYQQNSLSFWLGVASQYAIVEMNCAQGIYDQPRYGYDGQVYYGLPEIEKELDYLKEQSRLAEKERQQAISKELEEGDWMEAHGKLIDATIKAGHATGILAEAQRYLMREEVSRHEFEQNSAWGEIHAKEYLSMMNYESGRVQAYQETGSDKLKDAITKQLELAYQAGMEKGKSYFNTVHMTEMDLLIRSAGGQKAVSYVEERK